MTPLERKLFDFLMDEGLAITDPLTMTDIMELSKAIIKFLNEEFDRQLEEALGTK